MAVPWGSAPETTSMHSSGMTSVPGPTASAPVQVDASNAERRLGAQAAAGTAFVATLAAFATLASRGVGGQGVVLGAAAAVLVVLAAIDIDRRLIPNRIVLPAAALVLAGQLIFEPGHWIEWVVAALGAGAGFGIAHAVYQAGIGMGDVKLALLLGAALGWDVLNGLLIASLLAAAFGLYLILKHGAAARKQTIPFGPFLAAGALAILLFG